MARSVLCRARFKRFIVSASRGYPWMLSSVIAALGLIYQVAHLPTAGPIFWFVVIGLLGLFVGFVFMTLQVWFEYRRRTYDPTWILKYREIFESEIMCESRAEAAKVLLEQKQHLSNITDKEDELSKIDDVLDFFEDIGFYERGDQISPEVAHHYFYHWIRGYYQASREYIEAWRRKEPLRWEHIEELFETTSEIEAKKSGVKKETLLLSNDELETFLRQEMQLEEVEQAQ